MDTLFRLVSFQQTHPQPQQQQLSSDNQSSFNNSNSSSSSIISSKHSTHNSNNNYYHYHQHQQQQHFPQDEECFNFFMDEEDFSSSSSHNKQQPQPNTTSPFYPSYPYQQQQQHHHQQYHHPSASPSTTTTSTPTTTNTPPTTHGGGTTTTLNLELLSDPSFYVGKWANNLLLEAARAVSDSDTARLHQILWMLNELGSPYGDVEQKLASYFTQALFTRMTDSGDRCYNNMRVAADKSFSFETTRKMLLKFQEVSPWTTFGHVASNGALIDALDGEPKLHIIDISNTFCTQWPTLLEALATRMDDTPHLKLTTVLDSNDVGVQRVMKEIGVRLEKFARLMGVPFKFKVIHHVGDLSTLDFSDLDVKEDEALAINLVNSLHTLSLRRRDGLLSAFKGLNPRVVTVVEEEADFAADEDGFVRGFSECLRWFRVYFEALEESFGRTSNEKLMLERAAGKALVDLLACPEATSAERRENATRWTGRMRGVGFGHVAYSEEVCDDVRALLRRYKEGWSMAQCSSLASPAAGIFLNWRDQPVVWASAWKP
ncbi:protein SHORT-ROOT-like [Chenopodium quinoa]|uniref:protein SHORT-ROOT-like n=1 Tax=Chenopodium quinoa TaxID=63459 RepID=UPI000B76FEE4|nr:protein SHORT-ROOT-like [Chenopodium quinoa]